MIIKEVINSFSSINLVWPNGQPVSSNQTAISTNMLEVPPETNKTLMNINFYKEVPGVEYGLLQIKTDKDTLIIPVLIKVEVQGIKTYPSTFNFGIIDIYQNIKRAIPITISNPSKKPIRLKSMFVRFEENLLEFIPNKNHTICLEDQHQTELENSCPKCEKNSVHFYKSLCIIQPGEELKNFGYIMIDPNNFDIHDIDSESRLYKKIKGSLILNTNFTENPFIYLGYSYYLDKATFVLSEKNFEFFLQRDVSSANALTFDTHFRINSINNFPIISLQANNDNIKLNYIKDNKNTANIKFDFSIVNPLEFENKQNYFFIIKSSNNFISLIPFKFYEKSISLNYCYEFSKNCLSEESTVLKNINFNSDKVTMDFGMVSTSESGKRYIKIYNENPVEIMITDIEITSIFVNLKVESITNINKDIQFTNDFSKLYTSLRKKVVDKSKDQISFSLPRNSISTFCIMVTSEQEQEVTGILKLFFTKSIYFTAFIKSKIIKGNLNITPSVIRFEPAFPGLFQTKLISSKSSYSIPINVKSFKSGDHRFTPVLLTNTIISNNRTEIIKVIFDPSKVQTDVNNFIMQILY